MGRYKITYVKHQQAIIEANNKKEATEIFRKTPREDDKRQRTEIREVRLIVQTYRDVVIWMRDHISLDKIALPLLVEGSEVKFLTIRGDTIRDIGELYRCCRTEENYKDLVNFSTPDRDNLALQSLEMTKKGLEVIPC